MNFIKNLKESGLKATPKRVALLEYLYSQNSPQSYEDMRRIFSMDKATFYRNMHSFEDAGFVKCVETSERRYYEYIRTEHPHFLCLACGEVECLKEASFLNGYEIQTVQGRCPKCKE
jgi:Fe2+ or Zn2+ uptake regulation protein